MKITKTASGKSKVKISKKEWQSIGKTAGWLGKEAIFLDFEEGLRLGEYNAEKVNSVEELKSVSEGTSWGFDCPEQFSMGEKYMAKGDFYVIKRKGVKWALAMPSMEMYFDIQDIEITDEQDLAGIQYAINSEGIMAKGMEKGRAWATPTDH